MMNYSQTNHRWLDANLPCDPSLNNWDLSQMMATGALIPAFVCTVNLSESCLQCSLSDGYSYAASTPVVPAPQEATYVVGSMAYENHVVDMAWQATPSSPRVVLGDIPVTEGNIGPPYVVTLVQAVAACTVNVESLSQDEVRQFLTDNPPMAIADEGLLCDYNLANAPGFEAGPGMVAMEKRTKSAGESAWRQVRRYAYSPGCLCIAG
jgi:hypothetical protein